MEVMTRINEEGHVEELVCRLCGSFDHERMLHMSNTYTMAGTTDVIYNLLDSISVLLKLEEDEELMSKHTCLSCFNIAVDVQAFIDSSIKFQKTTLSQRCPEKNLTETQDIPLLHTQFGNLKKDLEVITHDNADLIAEPEKEYPGITKKGNYKETVSMTHRTKMPQSIHHIKVVQVDASRSNILAESQETVSSVAQNKGILPELDVENPLSRDTSSIPTTSSENAEEINSKNKSVSPEEVNDTAQSVFIFQNGKFDNSLNFIKKTEHEKNEKCQEKDRSKKCSLCSKTFPRQSQLNSHLVSHSGIRPFECKTCCAKFKYRRNLVEHSSIHNDNPSFICSVCGLTFKQRSNLLKHERIHRERDKHCYQCIHCGNRYTQSSHLRTHIRNSHENNKGYKCDLCDAVVLCQSSLKRHIATVHANSAKFLCPHCSKGFNNHQNYQGHLRRHSGERPYSCSVCTKTFTTAKALSRHRLIHQGIKNHKCNHCSKAFYELCDLKKHAKRHLKCVKKTGKSLAINKCQDNAEVVSGMNSLNLMVLTESLLFSEPQQLLETSASGVTEILLPDGKLGAGKVTREPVLTSGMMQTEAPNLQQSSVALSKISNLLRPGEEVLSSSLLPDTPVLSSAEDVENVTVLAETADLPPDTKTGVPPPIDPSRVLQPTDIGVEEALRQSEDRGVRLETGVTPQCSSGTDCPTMVVLSSVGTTHSEYLTVPKQESHTSTGSADIDGTRHQHGERVLCHATW